MVEIWGCKYKGGSGKQFSVFFLHQGIRDWVLMEWFLKLWVEKIQGVLETLFSKEVFLAFSSLCGDKEAPRPNGSSGLWEIQLGLYEKWSNGLF